MMESILREIKAGYIEKQILTSEVEVIDRLLGRSVEMQTVYDEMASKLDKHQQYGLWDVLLGVAVSWNPDTSKALREEKKTLAKLNADITKHAQKLSDLIKERENICETSDISAYEDYDFLCWVHRAAENNHYYQSYVKGKLRALSGQFDLKYWPDKHEIVSAIGEFAEEAEIYENNPWTEELLSSPKHSMADYLRVILTAIEDRKCHASPNDLLPEGFRLSDNAIATFINCTLDLEADDILSAENIKRSRQNIRDQKKVR